MDILNQTISWTHTISATLSLVFGTIVLFANKGDLRHKKLGLWYFYAMLINNSTALAITNALGKWFFPHYLAIACLVVIISGVVVVKLKHKYWLNIHIISMVISYYLLIGGAINEAFLHISKLRPFINDPIFGMTHMISQILFVGLLIYFLTKYRKFGLSK